VTVSRCSPSQSKSSFSLWNDPHILYTAVLT
jgi:hypothetical protein